MAHLVIRSPQKPTIHRRRHVAGPVQVGNAGGRTSTRSSGPRLVLFTGLTCKTDASSELENTPQWSYCAAVNERSYGWACGGATPRDWRARGGGAKGRDAGHCLWGIRWLSSAYQPCPARAPSPRPSTCLPILDLPVAHPTSSTFYCSFPGCTLDHGGKGDHGGEENGVGLCTSRHGHH